jgi:hypothetical protein
MRMRAIAAHSIWIELPSIIYIELRTYKIKICSYGVSRALLSCLKRLSHESSNLEVLLLREYFQVFN